MPNEQRGRLDSAIDRAVRGMMQIDPLPGLRRRIAGRLETPPRRAAWLLPAFAAAALCAILLISIVLLRSPLRQPVLEPQIAVAPPAAPASLPEEPRVVAPAPERPPAPPQQRRSRPDPIFGAPRDRVSAASVAAGVRAAPMGTPAAADSLFDSTPVPGGIAPLAPISIAPIRLPPIALAPVTVSALPDRR